MMRPIFFLIMLAVVASVSAQTDQSKSEIPKLHPGDPAINGLTVKPNTVRVTQTTEKDGKVLNSVSFTLETSIAEANGKKIMRVVGKSDDAAAQFSSETVLDAKTLTPIKSSQSMGPRSRSMEVEGSKYRITMRAAPDAEPRTMETTLTTPAFLGNLADLVVSAMKLKEGMKFLLPMFTPGVPDVDWQTFEVTGREDFKTSKGTVSAWVVKHSGASVTGTMYSIESPPYLVRWIFNQKDGTRVTLDQVLVSP